MDQFSSSLDRFVKCKEDLERGDYDVLKQFFENLKTRTQDIPRSDVNVHSEYFFAVLVSKTFYHFKDVLTVTRLYFNEIVPDLYEEFLNLFVDLKENAQQFHSKQQKLKR